MATTTSEIRALTASAFRTPEKFTEFCRNGGKPLGRERFYKETGIKESDWIGKHWARWGDAVREIGLEPNQMQATHDTDDLLEKFISLMRELGKFPTANEVKLKARMATDFPWPNSFARFGSKQQFALHIVAYCSTREGHGDIEALCAPIAANVSATPAKENGEEETDFGFVYLMKSGRHYEIGRTNHVGGRERDLAIQLPDKLNTVHSIRTDDPPGIEAYWHARFEGKRKNGEWFDLNAEDVKAFKRRRFM